MALRRAGCRRFGFTRPRKQLTSAATLNDRVARAEIALKPLLGTDIVVSIGALHAEPFSAAYLVCRLEAARQRALTLQFISTVVQAPRRFRGRERAPNQATSTKECGDDSGRDRGNMNQITHETLIPRGRSAANSPRLDPFLHASRVDVRLCQSEAPSPG